MVTGRGIAIVVERGRNPKGLLYWAWGGVDTEEYTWGVRDGRGVWTKQKMFPSQTKKELEVKAA